MHMMGVCFSIGASHSEVGYLSCIARDLDIDGFRVDVNHTLTHAYHLPPVVDDDDLIPLRDPCPTCPSSYNILGLQDYQTILPVAGKLYIFTVINYTPYSQIVVTPGCVPLSIFKPHDDYSEEDILYVECERPSAPNQYFLAKLVKDQRDLQWSYQTLTNYDDLTSNGAFQYYTDDFEQYQVYYAYARGDLLYFEGPDNGLYRFFSLPSRCAKVVRITCVDKHPHLLIECSNTSDSSIKVVNSVYLFEPDSGNYDPIFQGTAYSKCPVRFSNDGSIVGIFTGRRLLVKELFKQGRSAVIEDVMWVYDGLLTEMEGSTYAAYINTSGLYTLSVTRALGGHTVTPVRVGNSEDVCARTGCPLLEAINTNTIVAQCNGSVATFSVHPPKLLNSSVVSNWPVRFIFYKHLPSTVPPEHPAATAYPSPSILPHPTVTSPQQPASTIIGVDLIGQDLSLKDGGNNLRFLAFTSIPVFVAGCFAIAAIVMVYQKCWHLRRNRLVVLAVTKCADSAVVKGPSRLHGSSTLY